MHKYIIYYTTYKGIIVYIGMGLKGRETHTTSGVSHSYGLNNPSDLEVLSDLLGLFLTHSLIFSSQKSLI